MVRRLARTLAALWLAPVTLSAGAPDPDHYLAALARVTGAGVRAHMEVLAADDMQGRAAGTAGYERAAAYVAARFRAAGLQPPGDVGDYLQPVPLLETLPLPDSAVAIVHRDGHAHRLEYGAQFLPVPSFGAAEEEITAALAFVGFGIRAPEYDHDDFAGLDVRGKILVQFTGAPSHFATDERAYYSSSIGKRALAVQLGAVGIVSIRTPVDQERMPWSRLVAAAERPAMHWLQADGIAHAGFEALIGSVLLSGAGAGRLFELAGRDLDALFERHGAGATGGFDLGVEMTIRRASRQRRAASANVVGLLPGSDRGLSEEYLLLTAHLDHLGGSGEEVFNGAYDNAAGVAVMLEVAAAIAAMEPRPRRSVLFAALTAEEKGLQGSDYLVHHPPVPAAAIVANLNIDMPYLGFPIADVEAYGVEHSSLQATLQRAVARVGLNLSPDSRPELVRFIRSDQFSFVRFGIPGLNLKPGLSSADPAIDGDAHWREFLGRHYHQPSDDLSLPFDPQAAARFARTALLLGLYVADDDERPRWNPGNFFGDRFARP